MNDNDEDALKSLTMAIQYIERAGKKDSLEMAYAHVTRAIVLKDLNKYDECTRDILVALPLLEKSLGPGSVPAGTANGVLGNALRAQDKPQEAIREFDTAEKIYRTHLGSNHPKLATILLQKARALRDIGSKVEAISALRESLQIRIKVFGNKSPKVITVEKEIENLDI